MGRGAEPGRHLAFADHVRDVDPFERCRREDEGLDARHRSKALLDGPLIRFDRGVEILILTTSIGTGQPKYRNIRLMALSPAVLALLRSMTILRGRPFTLGARAKNLVAAVLLCRFDSMKSGVLPNLSTARQR